MVQLGKVLMSKSEHLSLAPRTHVEAGGGNDSTNVSYDLSLHTTPLQNNTSGFSNEMLV